MDLNLLKFFLVPFYVAAGIGLGALIVAFCYYLLVEASIILDLLEKRIANPRPKHRKGGNAE